MIQKIIGTGTGTIQNKIDSASCIFRFLFLQNFRFFDIQSQQKICQINFWLGFLFLTTQQSCVSPGITY